MGREPLSIVYGKRRTLQKVMGLNPGTVYWMDIFSHIFAVKIVMMSFEKTKSKRKRGRGWPIFEKILTTKHSKVWHVTLAK